nr:hypothetical protein CFP56_58768 [Quercus suber]
MDALRGRERERQGFLDEDVFPRGKGGEGLGFVEFVAAEDEDDVDGRVRVHGAGEGDDGRAVEMGEHLERREVHDLRDLAGADDADAQHRHVWACLGFEFLTGFVRSFNGRGARRCTF